MKIECNLRYLEEYLPTPRSRKLRHREATTTCMIDVLDISPEKAHVAFRVKSHSTDDISIPIFWHNNAFWKPEFVKNTDSLKQNTANAVRFKGEKDLRDFFNQKYQWTRCGQLQNLEEEIHRLQLHASDYAVISGLMCVKTNEPNYYVETGDDFVFISIQTWRPKGNSQLVWYFDALHFNEMKQKAAEFAKEHVSNLICWSKNDSLSGVPTSVSTLLEDANAIKDALQKLSDALNSTEGSCESSDVDMVFDEHQVRWLPDDIIEAAKEDGVYLTPEQAAYWWQTEGRGFREALTGAGNEMLRFVNWKDYAAQNQIVEVEATSKPHYFMVFIRSEFVRDAQFYNDESFSDDINIHDETHDESWTEISGPLMVWHGQADCAEAAIKQAMCLYSASENEFFAVEVVDIYKE